MIKPTNQSNSTQDTEDVVARVADALAKLPCRDFEGIRQGEHELDMLRRREAARAAIEATDRQSLSDRIDVLTQALARHNCGKRVPVKCVCVECCDIVDARAALHQEGIAAK